MIIQIEDPTTQVVDNDNEMKDKSIDYLQGSIRPILSSILQWFLPQILEMKLVVEGMEKERDFYFGKLR